MTMHYLIFFLRESDPRWQMEVSYLVGIILKKNLQILPFAHVPFRASLQVSVS